MTALPNRIPLTPPSDIDDLSGVDFHKNDPRSKLIIALDVSTGAAAQKIVTAAGNSALPYKTCMQIYTAEGPRGSRPPVPPVRRGFPHRNNPAHPPTRQ